MIELMKELCALPGPSGCEDAVRAFVLKRVKPFADEIRTDAIGNVMVFRKGRKALDRPVALCAHMDEVGVIIKKITEDGMLKFGFVGGVDPRVVIGRPVRFGDVPGVIGIKAVHLTTAAERRTMPKTKNLYIDIGATSRAAAEKLVSLGDYGVFDSAATEFGDGLIKAKAIDDRVGCAALLRLLEDEPPVDTWFCFTVQEETGLRGAASMAFALDPGFAMVLEGTTAADLAEVKGAAVCAAALCCRSWTARPFMTRRCSSCCATPAPSAASRGRPRPALPAVRMPDAFTGAVPVCAYAPQRLRYAISTRRPLWRQRPTARQSSRPPVHFLKNSEGTTNEQGF